MKLSTAVALRISKILREKNMSQYRLEKDIAMPHNTMKTLMGERNSGVNLAYMNVQALTFEQRVPNYGLYCNDVETITSGKVKFDLTDTDLLMRGKGVMQCEYQVTANGREVEFVIRFMASACELLQISVTANGQKVDGSVWYGDSRFACDYGFDVDDVFPPYIDETIIGTHYMVIPDNDTITIELSFNEGKRQSYIYDTSNSFFSSDSADGNHVWNMQNALSKSCYEFFIIGDASDHFFTSTCKYRTETMTCKEFIDSQYEKSKDYYDEIGIPLNLFYSLFNNVLIRNTNIIYDELFFDSIDKIRVNAYKFSLPLDRNTVICYDLPMSVQGNYVSDSTMYLVEQIHLGSYPVSYTVKLNEDMPYIIESNANTEKNGTTYTAVTADNFYFAFSSSEKFTDALMPDNNAKYGTVIVVCIVVCSVVVIGLTALIGVILYRDKAISPKRRKK